MTHYFEDVWKCRYFWLSLVQMDLRSRYRRSVLGMGWSLLHPIFMTAILATVFHKLFGMSIQEYAPSLLIGICYWNFITNTTLQGCQSLLQGEKYIRQYPLPIAIYPLRAVLASSFHFTITLAVVLIFSVAVNGLKILGGLPALVPTLLMMLVLGWSLAVLAGFANAYFPDTQHLSEVGLQILFYATPIIYPAEMLKSKGLGWFVDWNPMASYVHLLRVPLLTGTTPGWESYGIAFSCAAIVTALAVLTLVRLQKYIIFQL
jgi:lipopolysaccharide transport system permease protein